MDVDLEFGVVGKLTQKVNSQDKAADIVWDYCWPAASIVIAFSSPEILFIMSGFLLN